MKKARITTLLLAALALIAWATDNPVKIIKVKRTITEKPADVNFKQSKPTKQMMQRAMRHAEGGLIADFSIQGSGAQKTVWSEGFDAGMPAWEFNYGEGNAITFTLEQSPENYQFSVIDENDVQSLHIDGPYQTFKRTIGTATTPAMNVPANGQFHCYLLCNKNWNEYVVMTVSVSDDNFETSAEIWNSTQITESGKHWEKIDGDLSAFTGKDVKIRFTYGPGTNDNFKVGGYMGDFYLDGLSITAVETIDHVDAITGEEIQLVDLSDGNPTAWEWTFEGAETETSTEQNPTVVYTKSGDYDITLKVTDANGATDEITKKAFVHIEGQVPVARMITPASFRDNSTNLKMVAPMVPVQYHDASTGYPDEWTWAFETTGESLFDIEYSHELDPEIAYNVLNKKLYAVLTVSNDSGTTYCTDSIIAKYSGLVNNIIAGDIATNYDMGEATFPGAMPKNSPISGYAEKFSKPSRPIKIYGAYVYFNKAQAEEIYEQTMPIAFQLCESDNGVPGKVIDSDFWTIPEIGYAINTNNGFVTVEFTEPHVLNDEFFITIDGFTEKNETFEVSFAMTQMRDHDNTAYMRYNNVWRPLTGYFEAAPGGQASFFVYADIAHSVMSPIVENEEGTLVVGPDYMTVGKEAGIAEQAFFSYLGREEITSNADWCRVISEPNGLTLDTLKIEYDALPEGLESREAVLTFSDGADKVEFRVIQNNSGETAIVAAGNKLTLRIEEAPVKDMMTVNCPDGCLSVEVYDATGNRIARQRMAGSNTCKFDTSAWNAGMYIVRATTTDGTAIAKCIKE
ncbi:MAG: PKD domain-containing protein [Prevotella sp.]|nr:PKD domain-containing protein [Prevotella sp.]